MKINTMVKNEWILLQSCDHCFSTTLDDDFIVLLDCIKTFNKTANVKTIKFCLFFRELSNRR